MKQTNEISIEITREDCNISSVSVIMPTWNHTGSDNKLYAKIPFLGLETYGKNDNDLQVAIKEAIACFCIAAEKHGKGLEQELESLGWTKVENKKNSHSILSNNPSVNPAIDSAISTGDIRALLVDLRNPSLQYA